MKSIKRILATALMLAMVFTLLGSSFMVSAASSVTCTDKLIVVDDDFANVAKGEDVSAVVAGTTYKGVKGTTAFATIQEAYDAVAINGELYVAAGVYAGALPLNKSITLYGNMKNVEPNNPNDLSVVAGGRAVTGKNETILQDMQISYAGVVLGEDPQGSYNLTMNGFAVVGDSCIRLQDTRLQNSRINIAYNVFDLVNEKAYGNIGINDDSFSAVYVGVAAGFSYVPANVSITYNRIEKVASAGSGLANTNGIHTAWATDLTISSNYISNVTGDGFDVCQLGTSTIISDNYIKNAGKTRVHDYIRGFVEITGNTFDAVGGTTASGQYAFGLYTDASTNNYSSVWMVDTEHVVVSGNTFKNLGKAIRLYGRLRQSDAPINSIPAGAQFFENTFIPVTTADCTFIHMSYNDGTYAPPVYNNYTGGANPKDICTIDSSDATAAFDFGEYWLNEAMTDPSSLLDVLSISNSNGVSFAGAAIETAPGCTIATTIPAKLDEVTLSLEVKEGAYYTLYADKACNVPLTNNTVALTEGKVSNAYAKVQYSDYSIVYAILLTSKPVYSDYLDASEYIVGPEFAQYPAGQTIYVEVDGAWRRAVTGHSAFSDLGLAMDKAMSGDVINMTAGVYSNAMTIEGKGVKIRGAKAGINPNNMSDYSRSDARSNLNEETVFTAEIMLKPGINGLSFDGITFSEQAMFKYTGSFSIDSFHFDNLLVTGSTNTDALMYRGRADNGKNTFSNFRIATSRFEGNGSNYVMRLPNISNGIFEENVFDGCTKNIYMGGTDGSSTDVLMFKGNILNNVDCNNFFYIGQSTNGTNDIGARVKNSISFVDNKVINFSKATLMYLDRWTAGNKLTVTGNRFEGSSTGKFSVNCYDGYTGHTIDIHENYFGPSMTSVLQNNLPNTVADCSYNYFAKGAATAITGPAKYVPYYIDEAMTKLAGAYDIEEVISPAGAVLDAKNHTIEYVGTTPADFMTFNVLVSEGSSYKVYADELCTVECAEDTIALKGVETVCYIKTTAEDGVTSKVYTVTIKQPINSNAQLLGMDIAGSTWVDQGGKFNCVLPNDYVNGPILPIVSGGASVFVYRGDDTEMANPIVYNMDQYMPVGKTAYIIKVVSEDGENENVFDVTFTRSRSTTTELVDVKGGIDAAVVDGKTAKIAVENDVTSLLPEVIVCDGATYELYQDIGCNIYLEDAMNLKVGDNKFFAKVIAEDGETFEVYTIIVERLDKSAEKRILGDSFPEFATSQDEIDADVEAKFIGMKRIDNNSQVVYLQPKGYIASLEDSIVVSEGASYEIFKNYDIIENKFSGKLSSSSEKNTLKLAEGTNTFYVRVNASNGSMAVFTIVVINEIKNVSSDIITVNGFDIKREGNVLTGTASTDNPQIDIFVSENATAKVYADRKKTVEIASTMTSYTVTETKETFTNCKLNAPMPQTYMVMYVDVTSQTGITSSYEVKLTAGMFSRTFNDIEKHWAREKIMSAYQMGVTSGSANADGSFSFNPQDNATREQVAIFVCNLMGVDTASYSGQKLTFADSKDISKWATNAVKAITAMKIMQGDGSKFNPKANISRQEFMAVMVRAAALDTSKGATSVLKRFKDKGAIASWAKVDVATAVAYGLVNGDDKGNLNPTKPITRAEIVTIMVGAKSYVR